MNIEEHLWDQVLETIAKDSIGNMYVVRTEDGKNVSMYLVFYINVPMWTKLTQCCWDLLKEGIIFYMTNVRYLGFYLYET